MTDFKWKAAFFAGFLGACTSTGALAQSNVPLDSPRGNYEGADNIHWYQQNSLDPADYVGLPSVAGEASRCNTDALAVSCAGYGLSRGLRMYEQQGTTPVVVTIVIDSNVTEEFDFPFRRALDEIRKTNDAFSRSGVIARLYVSAIQGMDMSALGSDVQDIYEHFYGDLANEYAKASMADIVLVIRNTSDSGLDLQPLGGSCGWSTLGPSSGSYVPVVVLGCVDKAKQAGVEFAALNAAHQFGHVFGLGHKAQDSIVALLSMGYGFADSESDTLTIMAEAPGETRIPVFSSPKMRWQGVIQGDIESADAVTALNEAAATVGRLYEQLFEDLGRTDGVFDPFDIPQEDPSVP